MRDEIKLLVQLQTLDTTLRELHAAKEKFIREIAETERAALGEKQNLENRTAESKSFRKALDQRELDLKEIEGRIRKLELQLNTVKTNKEYAALQHEILGLKADKSRIEDEILRMLDQVEVQQAELKELARKADEAVVAARQRKEALQKAVQDADARIERVRAERAALAARIPAEYLQPYERLLQRRDKAMAACRNFTCDGCRMSLTANVVNHLMLGEKLVFCQSCGRILYIAADEDMTGAAAAGRKDTW